MKMCKTIPMFILLFTGYLCNSEEVNVTEATTPLHSSSPGLKVTKAPKSELETKPPPHGSDHVPEKHLSALLVAGISISFLFLFIFVIIGVWCTWKKSKGRLAETSSVPSGEPGVSLKRISTHENQFESPFERALQ